MNLKTMEKSRRRWFDRFRAAYMNVEVACKAVQGLQEQVAWDEKMKEEMRTINKNAMQKVKDLEAHTIKLGRELNQLKSDRDFQADAWVAARARAEKAEERAKRFESLLRDWESSTNHAATHLSPSGVETKKRAKALLLGLPDPETFRGCENCRHDDSNKMEPCSTCMHKTYSKWEPKP